MPVTITVEISDELARRLEHVIAHVGGDRSECLTSLVEFGIEDYEDAIEAAEISRKIDAGEMKTVRMREQEERLVAMGG